MTELENVITEDFRGKTIVVVGDLVADQFLRGTISRVSREAPVFILRHDDTETFAGGAANAATNVASLGGKAILIGAVGADQAGDSLIGSLVGSGVDCSRVTVSEKLKTTTKVRVLAGQHYAVRQQVIRIDYEDETGPDRETRSEIGRNLAEAVGAADAVIVSDYGYGAVNGGTGEAAIGLAAQRGIPVLVDSRFGLRNFRGATSATPNQDEVEQILGKGFDDDACERLRAELGFSSLLVTCGNKGMLLIEEGRPPVRIDAVGPKEPVDVTGAGDTVIATYALGLASGLASRDAATLANHAGGIVVMKKGTASVTSAELIASIAADSKNHA